jgi:hypothetical protein
MAMKIIAAVASLALLLSATSAPPANAEPQCMNYFWYSACHDKATDKWQLCNFGNDGKCQDIPAPLAPSPFDPLR